ncbi:MAG: prolyl oligopeptidase family serine peptidase, partial [Planctomycetota bacterium]
MNRRTCLWLAASLLVSGSAQGQPYGEPDRGEPGDEAVQAYLAAKAHALHARWESDFASLEAWTSRREDYRRELFYMLGLSPLPERTPLRATVTGTLRRGDYVVDKLHFQSLPGLYVTANLYRPAGEPTAARRPAVLYVCGHAHRGRNGNKTAYQSHGIWLARHGYVCLTVDSLQLGEIAATHHGTYREGRWWWQSRGYTPAGVECWNGIRAIDYLSGRGDVDADRIAVTGISGGGAATFWIAAADPRVCAAAPVSGMGDLPSYVGNRVINGHCDCMFLVNAFEWPWTRIAALIAPRPLLFVNSDADPIFPMDANRRVGNALERVYSLFGAGEQVDSVVSIGGHAYRRDIRRAVYRFLNTHLLNDPRPIADSEVDLVGGSEGSDHPIDPVELRVFVRDADLPADEVNTTIDQRLVPLAEAPPLQPVGYAAWRADLVDDLRRVSFHDFPERIPPAKLVGRDGDAITIETEPGIQLRLQAPTAGAVDEATLRVELTAPPPRDEEYHLAPRGVGGARWTRKSPPNYVERAHALVGRTVDAGRVWDIVATWRYLRNELPTTIELRLAGEGAAAVLATYAGVLEPRINHFQLVDPLASHMDSAAPQLLNVLRVCDVP